MPRPRRDAPRNFSADWPIAGCSDPDAEVMRLVAANLRTAIGERSVRSVAAACDMHHSVLTHVLHGSAWVEAATIARLERGLHVSLWPSQL